MDNHSFASGQDTGILAEIINLSADAVISLDENQNIVLYNAAAEKIFGYKTDEILGKPLDIILPESMHSTHKKLVVSYNMSGEKSRRMGHRSDLYGVAKSGELIPLDISIQKHPEGSSCRYTAICRDVGYRLEREKMIRDNEEKFRMLFNTSHHMTILMNGDGEVMEFNDTVARTLQVTPEKNIGKKIWDCVFWASEMDCSQIEAAVLKIKPGEDLSLIVNAIGDNNRKIILDISLKKIWVAQKEAALIILEGKNITEFVKSNKALVESKSRLARAQRIARIGNFEWTIVSNNTIWSDEIYSIFGLSLGTSNFSYETLQDKVHVDDREKVEQALIDALKGKRPYRVTHRIILDDGSEKVVEQVGEILRTEDGKAIRMDGTIQDVTVQWKREQELLHEKRRAEEADMAKAQFLSTVSHELQAPLNAIIDLGTVIAEEKLGEINIPTYRDHAVDINGYGQKLLGLIQNILQVTSYELGALKCQRQYLSGKSLLDKSLPLMLSRAAEKNINIETRVSNDIEKLFLDPDVTQQILVHLVDNAIKFSDESDTVKVNLYAQENEFVIDVIDQGVGLEDADEIFDLFVKKNVNSGKIQGGIGLGLTIVKNLTELQGGRVQVESKAGQGSRFSVYFSCHDVEEKTTSSM